MSDTSRTPHMPKNAPTARQRAERAARTASAHAELRERHQLEPKAPTGLWTPPMAQRELVERRLQYAAEMAHMYLMKDTMDYFNKQLQEIDPYLQLVKAQEKVKAGNPLRPGFWHIIRHNPGAPPSVMTIEGENGEYIEPSSRIFELLQKNDMWNSNSLKEENRKRRKLEEAEQRQKERERESRQEEMLERWNAVSRAQVSMLPGWSQNVAGRRGRS